MKKENEKDWTGDYRSVVGCLGAHNLTEEDRAEHDYYATDPIAAEWLMKIEKLDNNIWECACGEGHLAKPFIEAGYKVKCTDLIDRGFGEGGGGFPKTNKDFRWRYSYKPTI